MTKITSDRLNRKFEMVKGFTTPQRRDKPLDQMPLKGIMCLVCKKTMKMSVGQTIYWHKECRAKGRRLQKRTLAGKKY